MGLGIVREEYSTLLWSVLRDIGDDAFWQILVWPVARIKGPHYRIYVAPA